MEKHSALSRVRCLLVKTLLFTGLLLFLGTLAGAQDKPVVGEGMAAKPREVEELIVKPKQDSPVEAFFKSYLDSGDYNQFGYNLLTPERGQVFQPSQVGPDYVIGPQDVIQVNVWGGAINEIARMDGAESAKNYNDYTLTVDGNGAVIFPEIGRLTVNGLTLYELRQIVAKKYRDYYRNCTTSVTIDKPRMVQVLVTGKVNKPGYTEIYAGSSLFDALLAAGGVNKQGSLREIVVKRAGGGREEVIDLYQFIVAGKMAMLPKLNFKDSVHVKNLGPVVLMRGRVAQPAIYELKKGESLKDLITFAGGVLPDCEKKHVEMIRFDDGNRKILNIDGTREIVEVKDGDIVTFLKQNDMIRDSVLLKGEVHVPKTFAWHKDFYLKDIIKDISMFKPETSLEYAEIQRYNEASLERTIISFSPAAILESKNRDSADAMIQLQPYDEVVIFSRNELREKPMVSITGGVMKPGQYNWIEKFTLKNLIRSAGGIKSMAFDDGKIVRYTYKDKKWETATIDFSLSEINQKETSDIVLEPLDRVVINRKSDFSQTDWKVSIQGEVNYPGVYPVGVKTRLSDVIGYAGKTTENADLSGLVLVRAETKGVQEKHQNVAEDLLKKDLVSMASETRSAYLSEEERMENKQNTAIIQDYLGRLQSKGVQGRMLLREEDLVSLETLKGSPSDVYLKDDDSIVIPERKNMVTIVGEVFNPTSYLYMEKTDLSDYLERAGGVSDYADLKAAFVVRTNGTVISYSQKGRRFKNLEMKPGDVVIIPSRVLGVSKR